MPEAVLEFQIVIVGAGPAGLAAACVAAESGRSVAVVEETPWLGGQIWRRQWHEGQTVDAKLEPTRLAGVTRQAPRARSSGLKAQGAAARRWFKRFEASGVSLVDRTAVIVAPEPGVLLAEHPDGPREIRWQRLIVATGARELFLPFPGWTLPGVFGPGGLLGLVKNGWPIQGQRVVLAGTGPLLLATAAGLQDRGARIVCVAEQAPWQQVAKFGLGLVASPAKLWQAAILKGSLLGVPYRCGVWPMRAEGEGQVRAVTLTDGHRLWTEQCDCLACAFGLVPNVELPLALGCARKEGCVKVDQWQATSVKNVYCAGEPTGIGGAECALVEGQIAGYAASEQRARAEQLLGPRQTCHRFRAALAAGFALRPELKSLARSETLVCRCEDVTFETMGRFNSWREAKLQSRCGMGPCQGRICGAAARLLFGWEMESVRPPILPVRVSSLVSSGQEQDVR